MNAPFEALDSITMIQSNVFTQVTLLGGLNVPS